MIHKSGVLLIVFTCVLTVLMGCSSAKSKQETGGTPSDAVPPPASTIAAGSNSTDLPLSSFLPGVPRISVDDVKARMDAGANILIVDSRGQQYYDKSHIAGAISLPLDDMAEPYHELAGYDLIVTYCT